MTRTFALLLAVGTMLTLAIASTAGAASIVTYPLPEYEVSGSKYVNEDITSLVATTTGDIWWDAFAPGNLGEIEPANATPGAANGQRVIQVPGNTDGDYPEALALGPDGDLYFGLANPGGLWKIEPTAASPTPILVNNKTINNGNRPVEAAFSPKDGNLFFTSRANTVVEALDPGLESLTSTGEVSEPYPWGIAVDSAGNAWIGEDGRGGPGNHGVIGELPYASGDHLLEYPTPDSPSEPQQLTVDHSGNVWFIDRVSNSIGELIPAATSPGTSNGITEYKIPVPTGGNAEEEPEDITTAANGSIWFTESYKSPYTATANNQIGEITPVSGQSTVVFSMQPTPDGKQPQAIVGDAAGNVWYSAGGGNSSDELGEIKGATTGGNEGKGGKEETKGGEETKGSSTETPTTTTTNSSPTTSSAVVETVTTSSGQSITLATAPGEAGYAELDKHLLGGLSGNDIAKLLANGGFSIQIPLTYPAYPGNYSANGTASPEGIPGYDGEGVDGGEVPGSGGDSLAVLARKKTHHHLAPVVLFRYQHDYTAPGTYTAKINFTSAGLKLLRAAARAHHSLKVSIALSLTAAGHTPINQKLSTTLKAGSKAGSKKSGKR